MNIFNKIKKFLFKTPSVKAITGGYNKYFSFQNSNLASNETIYAAINMLSDGIASAPLTLNKGYEKVNMYSHPLARIFKDGPNNFQTPFDFMKLMETLVNTKGAAYAIKEYDLHGNIESLWVLATEYVQPVIEEDTREVYYLISKDGYSRYVHSSHIIDIHGLTTDGLTPISPLDVLKNTINYDRAVKEFSIHQMDSALVGRLVIKLQTKLNKDDLDRYSEMIGNFRKSGILFIDQGKELQELNNTEYIDPNIGTIENITVSRVEKVFKLYGKLSSSEKIKDSEDLLYLKDTLLPKFRNYEHEFNKKLLTVPEKRRGYEIKFNLNGFMRAQAQYRGQFYQQMIRMGAMNPNEVRALEDLPPYEGGEKYMVSRDLCPIEQLPLLIQSVNTSTPTDTKTEEKQ